MFEGNTRVQKYVSQHDVKARSVGHQTSATEVHGGSLQPWREIMMRNTQTWKLGSLDLQTFLHCEAKLRLTKDENPIYDCLLY